MSSTSVGDLLQREAHPLAAVKVVDKVAQVVDLQDLVEVATVTSPLPLASSSLLIASPRSACGGDLGAFGEAQIPTRT